MQSNYHGLCVTDSSRLDHDYGMEPLWPQMDHLDQITGYEQVVDHTDHIGGGLQELDQMVFSGLDYIDEFASAPTPYMANQSNDDLTELFGEIDTDDLMSQNEVEIATHNLIVTGEAEVSNDAPPSTSSMPTTKATTRAKKRKVEEYYDDSDDDSDDQSVATIPSKSRAGRKPNKGQNKCMSRNAIAARENREKKKNYINNMERKQRALEDENKKLRAQLNDSEKNNEKLTKEVQYYKGVLANDSSISNLLRQMAGTNQIELVGTQFVEMKPSAAAADLKPQRKSHRIASTKGDTSPAIAGHSSGICLHINNNKVSLELCAKCSQKQTRKGK